MRSRQQRRSTEALTLAAQLPLPHHTPLSVHCNPTLLAGATALLRPGIRCDGVVCADAGKKALSVAGGQQCGGGQEGGAALVLGCAPPLAPVQGMLQQHHMEQQQWVNRIPCLSAWFPQVAATKMSDRFATLCREWRLVAAGCSRPLARSSSSSAAAAAACVFFRLYGQLGLDVRPCLAWRRQPMQATYCCFPFPRRWAWQGGAGGHQALYAAGAGHLGAGGCCAVLVLRSGVLVLRSAAFVMHSCVHCLRCAQPEGICSAAG